MCQGKNSFDDVFHLLVKERNNNYFEDLEKRVDSEAEAEVQGLEAQFRAGKARNNLEGLQDNPPLSSSSLGIRHS